MSEVDNVKMTRKVLTGIRLDDKWIKSLKPPLLFFTWNNGHTDIWDNVTEQKFIIKNKKGEDMVYFLDPRHKLALGEAKIPYFDIHQNDAVPKSPKRDASIDSKIVMDWIIQVRLNAQNKPRLGGFTQANILKWGWIIGIIVVAMLGIWWTYNNFKSDPVSATQGAVDNAKVIATVGGV